MQHTLEITYDFVHNICGETFSKFSQLGRKLHFYPDKGCFRGGLFHFERNIRFHEKINKIINEQCPFLKGLSLNTI